MLYKNFEPEIVNMVTKNNFIHVRPEHVRKIEQ